MVPGIRRGLLPQSELEFTHLLFNVTPNDPVTLALVSVVLIAVGALAGYIPARRAMQVDPMVALRYE
jgi:ABC-type lipoprotein release transport system permease subunit